MTFKNGVTSITTIQLLIVLRQKLYINDIVTIITAISLITSVTFHSCTIIKTYQRLMGVQ
jgi:hypothetical protein